MTLYTKAIRDLIYENPDKYRFLISTGLYHRYLDSIVLLDKMKQLYENEELEELIKRGNWIDIIRATAIDYVVSYILFRDPNKKEMAEKVAEIINLQVTVIQNYIQAILETLLVRARGESPRILAVSQALSYFGDLISFFEEVFFRPIDDVLSYVLYKRNYIRTLIEQKASVAKKVKEVTRSMEELAASQEQPEVPSEELSKAATDVKLEYISSIYERPLIKPTPIFTDKEVELITTLIQRGAFYPKLSVSEDDLAATLSVSKQDLMKIINSIWGKCKEYNMDLFIVVSTEKDPSGNEINYISIDPNLFRKSTNRLVKAHPDLVELFLQFYGA
ncbi:MAG: hypothetical protein ACP5GJ_03530 [Nanopusillaceae archaeon]|jgi:hypothetical protein